MCKHTRRLRGYAEGAIATAMAGLIVVVVLVIGFFVFLGLVIRATYDMAVLTIACRKGRA